MDNNYFRKINSFNYLNNWNNNFYRDSRISLKSASSLQKLNGQTMGTNWNLNLFNPEFIPINEIYKIIQNQLDKIISQMSHFDRNSELSKFNNLQAGNWQEISQEFAFVLNSAINYSKESDGLFDVTIGNLIESFGFGTKEFKEINKIPNQIEIEEFLKNCGYQKLKIKTINFEKNDKFKIFQSGNLKLNLSGIAKGFAVDFIVETLQNLNFKAGLLEIGGELRSWGNRPNNRNNKKNETWKVLINSDSENNNLINLKDFSLATSGDFYRKFEFENKIYSHTINAKNGKNYQNKLVSVTVGHQNCMDADALASILFLLGLEEGIVFADKRKIPVLFQTKHQKITNLFWDKIFKNK